MSLQSGNITSGFIDLATFDELEKYLYGGPEATAYFVMAHKTSTWFTLCPTILSKTMGQAGFGQDWAASISRAGDYLKSAWLRVDVGAVTAKPSTDSNTCAIRWTHNFAHNLIREAAVTFNDLIAERFDNYFLDFWAAFTVPASKQAGYNNMIGNTPGQYDCSHAIPGTISLGNTLPAFTINLPLPFFFTRDTGVALPTAALPYNEMRISLSFRDWTHLLVAYSSPTVRGAVGFVPSLVNVVAAPVMSNANVWAEYAIVSNDERKRMGCAPRDILIEQVQTAPRQTFKITTNTAQNNSTDIRFSHAVKYLFFAGQNTTVRSDWSNYTLGNVGANGWVGRANNIDTVSNATLLYENTQRLSGLPADYYSLVEPWYKAPTIPRETGYHMYSYSVNMYDVNPMGSTNYGKLTNVTLVMTAVIPPASATGFIDTNTYEGIIVAVNNNVIRVSGGALGFPVL